jgi:hypothetical protein
MGTSARTLRHPYDRTSISTTIPRWLANVGREREAIEVLAAIQAGGNVDDPLVVAEWEESSTVLTAEREGQKLCAILCILL